MNTISPSLYKSAIISGANCLYAHIDECNALNVFPVPDGDTGTNMSLTVNAAKSAVQGLAEPSVSDVAATCAKAMLRGARGNSGVILSLLFRGFSEGFADVSEITPQDFAKALDIGVKAAYGSVMNPTEGTILTVARVAAEESLKYNGNDIEDFLEKLLTDAKDTLAATPELLPVLKKAGVVDAGGQGFVYILEGFYAAVAGTPFEESTEVVQSSAVTTNVEQDLGEIEFGYCTEYIVNTNEDADPAALRTYLESIGDSVVCVADSDIIKIHVHTNTPGNAITMGLKHGFLTNMKIDNMRVQHENIVVENAAAETEAPADQTKDFGFVSVCSGDGVSQMFADLGADELVTGGQTMNPSTEDILKAVERVPAKTVFVFPNNKNIIMAAEAAAGVATRNVIVLQTRTIPQGISAMLAFDENLDTDENAVEMTRAIDGVKSGSITFAARDSDFDGHKIKSGDILALEGGKLAFTDKNREHAIVKLAAKIASKKSSILTVICGEEVDDAEMERTQLALEAKLGAGIEVNMFPGGQPVYSYIIGVE